MGLRSEKHKEARVERSEVNQPATRPPERQEQNTTNLIVMKKERK